MGRIPAVLLAALLAPILFVAAYLSIMHVAHWPHGGVLGGTVTGFAVLAGVAPILLAKFPIAVRILFAALYVIPCLFIVSFFSLAFDCSMFQRCLS